jgi:hypothetical protein
MICLFDYEFGGNLLGLLHAIFEEPSPANWM